MSLQLSQRENPRPKNAPFLLSSVCHCLSIVQIRAVLVEIKHRRKFHIFKSLPSIKNQSLRAGYRDRTINRTLEGRQQVLDFVQVLCDSEIFIPIYALTS